MFNTNEFKRNVKEWFAENEDANPTEVRDYCEEMIPVNVFTSYVWLVDQTVDWVRHIQAQKDQAYFYDEDLDDVA